MRAYLTTLAASLALLAAPASALAAPVITNTSFSEVTETSATLEASVDPNGSRAREVHFDYITQTDYEAAGNDFGPATLTTPDQVVPATVKGSGQITADSSVIAELSTEDGTFAAGQTLTGPGIPAGTEILAASATSLTISKAATATSAPDTPIKATGPQPVTAQISGLAPATIYRFRALASNSASEDATGPTRLFQTLVPTPSFGPCPNDPSRSGPGTPFGHPSAALPDCRAYEQASPLDKNGEDAAGQFALTKAATDGSAITFGATFGIPEGLGAQALPSYAALRGGPDGEWDTQGLLPPPDFGERAQVQGWLPDFSRTYANATRLGSPRTSALVEQSPDGQQPRIISPYTPRAEYSFAGAAADGSVVLFESEAQLQSKEDGGTLIDAARQGNPNVYAWDRGTGELSLAGVLNDGSAPPRGSLAGPYAWSRGTDPNTLQVGGARLGYYLRGTHAFSDSGDVYFTAVGTGQLYLRRNPTQPQSAMAGETCLEPEKACTIQVSATQRTTPDPAGPQPAAFMAASADGSVAYFTSSEKLTELSNTGPEQPAAQIGHADLAAPDPDAAKEESFIPTHAAGITTSTDGEFIYWADPASGTIGRANLKAPDPADTVEPGFLSPPPGECEVEVEVGKFEYEVQSVEIPSAPRYLAIDEASHYLYWTNTGLRNEEGRAMDGGGTVGRADFDASGNLISTSVDPDFICGEAEPAPGTREKAVSNPQGIAVNSSHIYWANAATEDNFNRSLGRAGIGGEGVEAEFVAPPTFNSGWIPYGVALDSTHIYFALDYLGSGASSYIERVTLEGTEPLEFKGFGIGGPGIRGLGIDGTQIYWATQGEEAIGRAPLADLEKGNCSAGSCKNALIKPAGSLEGVALNGSDIFWSVNGEAPTNPGTDLYRFDADGGGSLEDLTVQPDGNGAEAQGVLGTSADGSYLYFAANADLDGGGEATKGDCQTQSPHGEISQTDGACNVYLWHGGEITFVARVRGADAINWTGTPREVFSGYVPKSAFVSKDGRALLFRSSEQLTEFENEGFAELYRFRMGEPELRCVSCSSAGGKGASLGSIRYPGTISPLLAYMGMLESRNLSTDGNRVFFETAKALVTEDTNEEGGCPNVGNQGPTCQDLYEWEAPGFGTCTEDGPAYSPLNDGCIYLISTGTSEHPSYFADASTDGSDVFFFTRAGLVGSDTDNQQDVYDARIGGGIATQNPIAVPPCESAEGCHGPDSGVPAQTSPGSAVFSGPADPKPKHKQCKKAKKKKKKGCGKKKKSKHKKNRNHRSKGSR